MTASRSAGTTAPDIESSSDAYARRFSGPLGAWFLDVQARATLDLVAPLRARTALEVGGGHAQLTGPLVGAGLAVSVLGSSPACGARIGPWSKSWGARFVAGLAKAFNLTPEALQKIAQK